MPRRRDANAVEMSELRGELLGLVADVFDDLESRLAQSRNRFFDTWNEAAFHQRGDDGAPPAIPLAATSLTEAGAHARHPASGGNQSLTTKKVGCSKASSTGSGMCTFKPSGNSGCPITSAACTTSHTSSSAQQTPHEEKFEADRTVSNEDTNAFDRDVSNDDTNLFDMIRKQTTKEQENEDTNGFDIIRKQTTKELITDLHIRTTLVGQFRSAEDKQGSFERKEKEKEQALKAAQKWSAKDYVTSAKFDLASASVIILNAMVMGFEVQCKSFDDGYAIGYPGQNMRSTEAWLVFGLIFTVELLIKLFILRWEFHKTRWNVIDVLVVACWFVTLLHDSYVPFNPTFLRLLRILKLIRLAKMFKTIEVFDSLQVLVGSIRACFSALVWSSFLLILIQTLFAFLFNTLLTAYVLDENQTEEDRFEVFGLFGSFSRAMMSMAELTLGNWVPICRVLYEKVAATYGYIILVYVILVNFAVVRVITGVFLQTTFSVAAMDDDLMVVQKLRATASHRAKMMRLLNETDLDGKGYIDKEDFRYALYNSKLKQWLSAMGLEVNDPDLVFDFLDNGDGRLDYDELIQGVSRLKGSARSIDVVLMNRRTLQLGYLCKKIIKRLDSLTYERNWARSK